MRKTTRNLIGRAERDGVTVRASADPNRDLHHFLTLHEETRKRHGFTAYSDAFFRAQVKHFSARRECSLYLAEYQGNVISASIHMHCFGETSYHHGASDSAHTKIPASYLVQWTAIKDALKRGDKIYNFWGIAPDGHRTKDLGHGEEEQSSKVPSLKSQVLMKHPFSGVTLFKTGFGGTSLSLSHCTDVPLSKFYRLTYAFESLRKWRRGF